MCKRSVTEMELSFLKWLRGRCKLYCECGQAIHYLQVLRVVVFVQEADKYYNEINLRKFD